MTSFMLPNRKLTVSVIIPTRDRPEALGRLLDRLGDFNQLAEIIVVDEASDPPVALSDPKITVIRHVRPKYLSAARNSGAILATGDVLIFVDDDCVLDGEAIRFLGGALAGEPSIGVAGPVIAYLEEPSTIWSAGNVRRRWTDRAHYRAQGLPLGRATRLSPDCMEFPSVFAIRRDLFRQLGGFDATNYPMHMSEGDLCQRARMLGYKVRLVPDAVVWHDIPVHSSWMRRLHVVGWRAYFVGRDRVVFMRHSPVSAAERAMHLLFWFGVLVPAYLVAIIFDSQSSSRARLGEARLFLLGNWHGLRGTLLTSALGG
jgi:GT2 family glycosyltransferase